MNANANHKPAHRRHNAPPSGRILPFIAACLATLLALPVNAAVVWPDNPLQSGASVPPNIMFILDNSGSMALVSMPFDVQDPVYVGTSTGASQTGLKDNPHDRSYLNNTIYYDPRVNYQPWMTADGKTRLTGGTDVSSVFLDWNLADTSRGTRDLRDNSESIFYVPKAGVTSSTNPSDFDRYWIRNNGGTAQVVTTAVASRPAATPALPAGPYTSTNSGYVATISITVPAGATSLRVFTTGGSNLNRIQLELYNTLGVLVCTSNSGSAGETCTITSPLPAAGTWTAKLKRDGSGSGANFSNVKVDAEVIAPKLQTPTGRTQADELKNIATWYSYARTRIKTAKSGASEAFASLGRGYRVGYTPINGRSSDLSSTGTGPIIPVDKDEGRFEDDSSTLYQSVLLVEGSREEWFHAVAHDAGRGRPVLHPQGQERPLGRRHRRGTTVLPAEFLDPHHRRLLERQHQFQVRHEGRGQGRPLGDAGRHRHALLPDRPAHRPRQRRAALDRGSGRLAAHGYLQPVDRPARYCCARCKVSGQEQTARVQFRGLARPDGQGGPGSRR